MKMPKPRCIICHKVSSALSDKFLCEDCRCPKCGGLLKTRIDSMRHCIDCLHEFYTNYSRENVPTDSDEKYALYVISASMQELEKCDNDPDYIREVIIEVKEAVTVLRKAWQNREKPKKYPPACAQ